MSDKQIVLAAMRSDFRLFFRRAFKELLPGTAYQPNWHIDAICHALDGVIAGLTRRLLITLPPRHLKSTLASAAFPAYLLGRSPHQRVIAASYGQDLARELSMQTRQIMSANWYGEVFPHTVLSLGNVTQDEFHTTANGFRMATSVGGSLTGFGGDILIIDDPMKADGASSESKRKAALEWYQQTAATRLNDPKTGSIIVIQQRLHEEDLAGSLLAAGGWTHLNLPAVAEEPEVIAIGQGKTYQREIGEALHEARFPMSLLNQIRREIGSAVFAAQYQQEPSSAGAGILRWDDFNFFEGPLRPEPDDLVVQSWDFAFTANELSDYSVCLTWRIRGKDLHLTGMYRTKCDGADLLTLVPQLAGKFRADVVVIETNGAGSVIGDQLIRQRPGFFRWLKHHVPKDVRLMTAAPYVEMGRVHIDVDLPGLGDLKRELIGFPNSRHDDITDAFSLFFQLLTGHNWMRQLIEARDLMEEEAPPTGYMRPDRGRLVDVYRTPHMRARVHS